MNVESFYENSLHVKELKPSDFTDKPWVLSDPVAENTAVLFYASWCGHCQRFKSIWENLYRINSCIKLCSFNCAKYDQYYKSRLNLTEAVRGFPTIMFYHKESPVETFQGKRDPPEELVKTMFLFCQRHGE
jgi:thiol-disulfide isomerase/thioredoxin